jgi:hypothetical protein
MVQGKTKKLAPPISTLSPPRPRTTTSNSSLSSPSPSHNRTLGNSKFPVLPVGTTSSPIPHLWPGARGGTCTDFGPCQIKSDEGSIVMASWVAVADGCALDIDNEMVVGLLRRAVGEGVRWAVMKLSCGGRRRGGIGR